jgi:hypothetical protein
MGLRVSVYRQAENEYSRRWPNDATNGGITSRYADLCVVNVPGPFQPDDDTPAVMLVKGNIGGTAILVPAILVGEDVWVPKGQTQELCGPMAGGNYAATSDGRFGQAVEAIAGHRMYAAIPVHDRYETWEQYNRNFD